MRKRDIVKAYRSYENRGRYKNKKYCLYDNNDKIQSVLIEHYGISLNIKEIRDIKSVLSVCQYRED